MINDCLTAMTRGPLRRLRNLLLVFWAASLVLPLPAGAATAPLETIYLYSSPLTKAFFAANGSNYDTLTARWNVYLKTYGKAYREITRAQLLKGLPRGVLVLGSAALLDSDERRAIQNFIDDGGSIIATWATGVRDGKGKWHGYSFIETTFDLKVTGRDEISSNERFLNTFGDSPLTWPVPAGERIFLGMVAESPLRIDSRQLAGRYFNWSRYPADKAKSGAIAYSEKNGSRRVFLGFSESSWEYDERLELPKALDGVFAWLRREPRIFKGAWPDGDLSAQLLEMDTEHKYANAVNFARDLEAAGLRGTFYSLTSIAVDHKDIARALQEKHELAYHAELHVGFKGKAPEAQESRIKKMVDDMTSIVGSRALARVTGFRAPTESWDANTEILLRKYGVRHHVADPASSDARVPQFSQSEPGVGSADAIVVLPRTQLDDLNYQAMKLSTEQASELIARDFDYLHEAGALGVLSVHSQNYAPEGLMAKLTPPYLKRLQEHRSDVWVAPGGEIADWWRARARVVQKMVPRGAMRALEFTVQAPGDVTGVSFFVTHPAADAMPKAIKPRDPNMPKPELRRIDAFRSVLIFPRLPAGSFAYDVEF